MAPSRITCGLDEPCGRAEYSATCTPAPPVNPSCWCAADTNPANSCCVIPGFRERHAASYACSVTLAARRISANSAGLLTARHPAVTAVALAKEAEGTALARP